MSVPNRGVTGGGRGRHTHLDKRNYHLHYLSDHFSTSIQVHNAFSHLESSLREPAYYSLSHTRAAGFGTHAARLVFNISVLLTLQNVRAFTILISESQYSVGVPIPECERVFSQNRKTARGGFVATHKPTHAESQYSAGIPPPTFRARLVQVGTVQYNTTR